jgi:hypothetical protein
MDVMHERAAGLDVHKETVVAWVRIMAGGKVTRECRTFDTTTYTKKQKPTSVPTASKLYDGHATVENRFIHGGSAGGRCRTLMMYFSIRRLWAVSGAGQ